ncbi:MAG TPA: SMC family ATPase [Chloroflexota bacterium]|nr:SMC family ATPase [Chloroflexota bacterium]
MIPVTLRLKNFLSYGDNCAPIDFTSFRLACLSGDNGHGKSALLDAITWSLWGKARARSDEDLIHLGRLDMEVEFVFDLGSERYCVLRKRARRTNGRGRTLTGVLELQLYDPERAEYQSISGDTQTDTQRKIVDLLRMEYETFINSAFLLQGRADEFTVKPPGERKRILADLLGLSHYDDLEERARSASRGIEIERREIQATLAETDREIANKPLYEQQRGQAQEKINHLDQVARLQANALALLEQQARELEAKRAQLAEIRQRLGKATEDINVLERQRAGLQHRQRDLEAMIARGPAIQANLARLRELRDQEIALSTLSHQLIALTERRRTIDAAIEVARAVLVAEEAKASGRCAELERVASRLEQFRMQVFQAETDIAVIGDLDALREETRSTIQSHKSASELLRQLNDTLKKDMAELKTRLELLRGDDATCPLCGSDLGDRGLATLTAQFEADGRRMGDQYRENAATLRALDGEITSESRELEQLDRQVQAKSEVERKLAKLTSTLQTAEQAKIDLTEASQALNSARRRLRDKEYAPAEQKELSIVLQKIHELGYDAGSHEKLRREIKELASAEGEAARLAAEAEQLPAVRQQLASAESLIASRAAAVAADSQAAVALEVALSDGTALPQELTRSRQEHEATLTELNVAREGLGVVQQRINHCDYLVEAHAAKTAELARLADERSLYDELVVAFGRKGIQAMIIESAIPEIEIDANELLSRMSDGRLAIAFETQRDARSGSNVIETLDIRVSDEWGTRGYELYSGGEAFRVNLAIRIALSKLLARRAGARLQTLVIDEGFGTQDTVGRDRLVEAINAIGADFEKIIVVTHIAELKEMFPVRLEVVKTASGSQVVVS